MSTVLRPAQDALQTISGTSFPGNDVGPDSRNDVDNLSTVCRRWRGGPTHTRTPRTQRVLEASTQSVVGPVIDEWVPTTTAQCQPVTRDPDQPDVLELPDDRSQVAEDGDKV